MEKRLQKVGTVHGQELGQAAVYGKSLLEINRRKNPTALSHISCLVGPCARITVAITQGTGDAGPPRVTFRILFLKAVQSKWNKLSKRGLCDTSLDCSTY